VIGALVLRPPAAGEAGAITDLFNAATRVMYGVDELTEAEIQRWLDSPTVEPARDIRLAERDGTVVGYADVYDENVQHRRYWFDVRVHPDHGDEGAARALVRWLVARTDGEREPGAFMRGFVHERNELVRRVLEEEGYRLIRHSYRMAITLPNELEEPRWPEGIEVRMMRPGEEREVYEMHEECFADHWEHEREPYEEWAHWTVERADFDASLWFVALDGDELAGYALCRPFEAEPDMGWVEMLGVRGPWRRRGLAKALLHHVFREFAARGFPRVGLGVDAESLTGANVLYEHVGMEVVRRFDVYEQPLG
jgi:mycothiol synthase